MRVWETAHGGNGGERRDASSNDGTVTGRCAAKFANAGVAVGAIILMRQVGSENDFGSWEKPEPSEIQTGTSNHKYFFLPIYTSI